MPSNNKSRRPEDIRHRVPTKNKEELLIFAVFDVPRYSILMKVIIKLAMIDVIKLEGLKASQIVSSTINK